MSIARLTPLAVAAALLVALGGAAVMAGPQGLIDDYGDTSLSEYTLYKVLDQNAGNTNTSFSSPSGDLTVTSVGTTGAEQVLFFRSDYTLGVGEELRVDGPPTPVGSTNDFGLAVGATPTSLGDPEAGDNRSAADYLFVSYRSATQLNHRGFVNGSEVGQHQEFGVNADVLFIARPTSDSIELGYYDGSTRNILTDGGGQAAYTGLTDLSIFDNVGFYVDLRNDGAGYNGLDNLRLVPEPASVVLTLLGLVGLVGLIRRR